MKDYSKHLVPDTASIRTALLKLNVLGLDAILFVVAADQRLMGSLTDGDIRRGLINGLDLDDPILSFIQPKPVYVRLGDIRPDVLDDFRERSFKIIPVLDAADRVVDVLNLRLIRSVLPVDAVMMAGGRGQRLMPLTADTPKPMLRIGDKPIIEHNIDRLRQVGIRHIHLSINYLGHIIKDYFGDGAGRDVDIRYIEESKPMGTVGSVSLVEEFHHDYVLIMNSDLLTDIDFVDFFETFQRSGADMAVAATGYHVDIPYAVLEVAGDHVVTSLREKPRYTYFSNAGIYLLKRDILKHVPADAFFDITDLMDILIAHPEHQLITYPIVGYWLDIGKHDDFKRAQEDIKHLKL